ncbi:hypothetical protein CPB86DRAFT_830078, partial [Serendipita vermifera]
MDRVETLELSGDDTDRLIDEYSGAKVTLPNVKSWDIDNEVDILHVLDLSGAESLTLFGIYPPQEIMAPIPTQLTKLFLGLVSFKVDWVPAGAPQSLLALVTLELEDVNFEGPVRKYLHCPNLKNLTYRATSDGPPSEDTEEEKNHFEHPLQQLFDEPFFKATPDLETLSVEGLTLNDASVTILQSCAHLQSMKIGDCRVKEFLSRFTKSLEDQSTFPSLMSIRIDDSWPTEADMTYEEFIKYNVAQRPTMRIFGNERVEQLYADTEGLEDSIAY